MSFVSLCSPHLPGPFPLTASSDTHDPTLQPFLSLTLTATILVLPTCVCHVDDHKILLLLLLLLLLVLVIAVVLLLLRRQHALVVIRSTVRVHSHLLPHHLLFRLLLLYPDLRRRRRWLRSSDRGPLGRRAGEGEGDLDLAAAHQCSREQPRPLRTRPLLKVHERHRSDPPVRPHLHPHDLAARPEKVAHRPLVDRAGQVAHTHRRAPLQLPQRLRRAGCTVRAVLLLAPKPLGKDGPRGADVDVDEGGGWGEGRVVVGSAEQGWEAAGRHEEHFQALRAPQRAKGFGVPQHPRHLIPPLVGLLRQEDAGLALAH
eukprot:1971397-Rhodomonas_salina.1